ncbi:MAG: hypothetical protein HGA43_17325, partial [Nitrospirae bacterium]|nr:hypothetical protein [Nitrospirota bacterium]
QEAKDQLEALATRKATQDRQRELAKEESTLRAQANTIAARLAQIKAEQEIAGQTDQQRQEQDAMERKKMAVARKSD